MPTPRDMPARKIEPTKVEEIKLPAAKPTPKKQFVRPEHLMQRPFKGLSDLKKELS